MDMTTHHCATDSNEMDTTIINSTSSSSSTVESSSAGSSLALPRSLSLSPCLSPSPKKGLRRPLPTPLQPLDTASVPDMAIDSAIGSGPSSTTSVTVSGSTRLLVVDQDALIRAACSSGSFNPFDLEFGAYHTAISAGISHDQAPAATRAIIQGIIFDPLKCEIVLPEPSSPEQQQQSSSPTARPVAAVGRRSGLDMACAVVPQMPMSPTSNEADLPSSSSSPTTTTASPVTNDIATTTNNNNNPAVHHHQHELSISNKEDNRDCCCCCQCCCDWDERHHGDRSCAHLTADLSTDDPMDMYGCSPSSSSASSPTSSLPSPSLSPSPCPSPSPYSSFSPLPTKLQRRRRSLLHAESVAAANFAAFVAQAAGVIRNSPIRRMARRPSLPYMSSFFPVQRAAVIA